MRDGHECEIAYPLRRWWWCRKMDSYIMFRCKHLRFVPYYSNRSRRCFFVCVFPFCRGPRCVALRPMIMADRFRVFIFLLLRFRPQAHQLAKYMTCDTFTLGWWKQICEPIETTKLIRPPIPAPVQIVRHIHVVVRLRMIMHTTLDVDSMLRYTTVSVHVYVTSSYRTLCMACMRQPLRLTGEG